MATYLELRGLFQQGSDLANRVETAVVVAAEMIRNLDDTAANGFEDDTGTQHALRKTWAASAFVQTGSLAQQALKAILAQNRANTVAQIDGASDATLQTAVNKAVDLLAGV